MLGQQTIVKIKRKPHLPLRFNSDGTFKILQIADMHYGTGILTSCRDVLAEEFKYCSDLNTTQFVTRLIQDEKPDFVAFTGDNIFGTSTTDAAESLIKAFRPVMDSKLPWAAVLGNHDQESTMTREELMSFISLMDYSLSQVNPSTYDHSEIDGFGNYNIQVYGPWGSHLANTSVLNLYFLDSGDRAVVQGVRTYGWIKESQLHWLQNISQGNKLDPGPDNESPPALTFFHIPIPEVKDLWHTKFVGLYQEGVASSTVNSGVLKTLVSMRDVKAVFIGHDHLNDFCGEIDGIWFCYGGGAGYHGYGRGGLKRRARLIVMELEKGKNEWMGVEKIKTWKRLDDLEFSRIDEQVLWDRGSST
ncbi:putative inactive purple acid phosphatase 28 [Ranunculus cassubicifolius]